jgi:hypothetical protein
MITASHNPKEYNGYKVYGEDGAQMSPQATKIVVDYIQETTNYFDIDCIELKELKNSKMVKVLGGSFINKYVNTLAKLSLSKSIVKKEVDMECACIWDSFCDKCDYLCDYGDLSVWRKLCAACRYVSSVLSVFFGVSGEIDRGWQPFVLMEFWTGG